MKAMILAAGKGTRVLPLTHDIPKPMIPILGKPVMAYLIEHLAKYGVRDIMINVSHLHENIEQYFGEGHQNGVQIGYSFEGYVNGIGHVVPQPIGSAGGIRKIQDFGQFFDETTIVLCGDALIDLDLHAALLEHKKKGALATVIVKEVPWNKVSDYGVVIIEKEGRVVSFQEKPKPDMALSNLASTGIYIFEPEVIDLIPRNTTFDIGAHLFPLLTERNFPFFAQTHAFNWIDIGTITDYWRVLQDVLQGHVENMKMPGKQISDGVWVGLNTKIDWIGTIIRGPVYIGSGVHIESGCTIVGPSWIGHGSHLCAGAKVIRSILFEYTRVDALAELDEVVVFKDYMVDRDGKMQQISKSGNAKWGNARDRRLKKRDQRMDEVSMIRA